MQDLTDQAHAAQRMHYACSRVRSCAYELYELAHACMCMRMFACLYVWLFAVLRLVVLFCFAGIHCSAMRA